MNGRKAFIGYVQDANGNISTRAFYQSGSQGMWRSALHGQLGSQWIGKGMGEESTNLPIQAQQSLWSLSANQPQVSLSAADAKQAFYGGLQATGDAPARASTKAWTCRAWGASARAWTAPRARRLACRSFAFDNVGQAPNFKGGPSSTYSFDHPTYGKVDAAVYRSQDGQLQYLFMKDSQGRGWLAAAENPQSPLNAYGVRTTSVQGHDLVTPPAEYDVQVPYGYGGNKIGDHYIDAYDYVRRFQIIQDFLRARRRPSAASSRRAFTCSPCWMSRGASQTCSATRWPIKRPSRPCAKCWSGACCTRPSRRSARSISRTSSSALVRCTLKLLPTRIPGSCRLGRR